MENIELSAVNSSGRKTYAFGFFTAGIVLCTALLIMARFMRYPSDVIDAVNAVFPEGIRLGYPAVYTAFAPFFQLADHFTILSVHQHISLLIWLNAGWLFFGALMPRRSGGQAVLFLRWVLGVILFNAGIVIFALIAVLVPRPMAAIHLDDPDMIAVDFHSHTSFSWDARKSFTPYKNLLWHAKAGFNASFITDHNVTAGSREAQGLFALGKTPGEIIPLQGEEISLYKAHWVLLGNAADFPAAKYNTDYKAIEQFVKEVESDPGFVLIASLPEYWLYHWDYCLTDYAKWGVDGFEIDNSAPIALDFPPSLRKRVLDVCRKNNLIVTGITDNHGWGSTVYVWNVMRIPGWKGLSAQSLQQAILAKLKKDRFASARVLTRVKAEPKDNLLWLLADPYLQAWECARSMPLPQTIMCIFWLWFAWTIMFIKNRKMAGI